MLTAAAAAVNSSVSSVRKSPGADEKVNTSGVKTAVNGATPLRKEGLLSALLAVGLGVKAPTAKRKGAKGGVNTRKKDPLATGLLAAIEVCEANQCSTR